MSANKLNKEIITWCNLNSHFVVRINNIPGTKHRAGTVTKGVPDIMGCTNKGRALAIETKTTDKQSIHQKLFEENFKRQGGIYILAKSLDDVIKGLK